MSNLTLFGADLFGDPIEQPSRGPVADAFLFSPFTILDARQGAWQERKRAWIGMGIKGEMGRDKGLTYDTATWLAEKNASGELVGAANLSDTSIFDPVLCELAYRWWCPAGGQVVDPFAGGSVRGIVAGAMGLRYWGCDLSREQIDANEAQANDIQPATRPAWICGDSMDTLATAPDADFVFSCPPYGDLEKYSDDPRDLSSQEWHTFEANYGRIILRAVKRLKPNRFACFVVGDFRDAKGFYRNFVGKTVDAFENAGAKLYNEAILATAVGSASMRVTRQFDGGRKLCKTHQNVLVFCKGDWRKAAKVCLDTLPGR